MQGFDSSSLALRSPFACPLGPLLSRPDGNGLDITCRHLAVACTRHLAGATEPATRPPYAKDSLPKCSKEVDSSTTCASCVGSNPTAVICLHRCPLRAFMRTTMCPIFLLPFAFPPRLVQTRASPKMNATQCFRRLVLSCSATKCPNRSAQKVYEELLTGG